MIRFEQVSKTYPGGYKALEKITFALEPGEMAFLTGHSGAGKSTLLKLVCLMERPNAGQVFINGVNLSQIGAKQIPYIRRDIGMIFQNHRLLRRYNVLDNVALPLMIEGYSRKEMEKRACAALDKVGLYDKRLCFAETLSGGEQQRVGIARAIVTKPPILLADEPTGNLDPALSMEILNLFEEFQQSGVTVLIATHDLGLIARMRHRIFTLKQGNLIKDGLQGDSDEYFV